MEKEEKVIVILLSMIFFSLSIAYLVFLEPDAPNASLFSGSSLPGDDTFIEGTVISKSFTYSGGHLLLTVDSISGPVKVFVPSDNGANAVDSLLDDECNVRIFGKAEEYEGELELVVQKVDDVTVL